MLIIYGFITLKKGKSPSNSRLRSLNKSKQQHEEQLNKLLESIIIITNLLKY